MRCSEHARARSSALCSTCTALIRVPKGNQGRPYKSTLAIRLSRLPAAFLFTVARRRGDATREAGGPHRPEQWAWARRPLDGRLCSLQGSKSSQYLLGNHARVKPHPAGMGG